MNSNIYVRIAITLSMLLMFALDCALLHTSAYNSLIQQFVIDISRDFNLMGWCRYDSRHSNKLIYIVFFLLYNYPHRFEVMWFSFGWIWYCKTSVIYDYHQALFRKCFMVLNRWHGRSLLAGLLLVIVIVKIHIQNRCDNCSFHCLAIYVSYV